MLNEDEILEIIEEVALEATAEYSLRYGIDHQIDEEQRNYLLAYAIVILFGYNALVARTDIPESQRNAVLARFKPDYGGVNVTTSTRLANQAPEDLRDFFRQRNKEIIDGLTHSIRNELEQQYAQEDGFAYVGAISRRDERVRLSHQENDGKFWRVGTREPMYDFGCRCVYIYFKTRQDAINAGFVEI